VRVGLVQPAATSAGYWQQRAKVAALQLYFAY
jgi:hypothetical protein